MSSRWRRVIADNRLGAVGGVLVVALVLAALLGPAVYPPDPTEQHLTERLQPPSAAHPLGTDELGRDVLARLLAGARISLGVAVLVTTVRVLLGTLVGLVAGYAGGWVDEALMRFVDVVLAFPGIVLALIVAGVLGPSLLNVTLALAVVGWSSYARLVRGTSSRSKSAGSSRPRGSPVCLRSGSPAGTSCRTSWGRSSCSRR
ncbi:ABC transporter permease [Haloarculaceae archaeon H-GB2-1]|nr:ABC transporter permease [Haloarculaceae archaeon H-GB2-1]